jgi:CheY-like chemotaxis protein
MPVEVLLVEDNRGDVTLVQEAMEEVGLTHTVNVVSDGMEAMEFLRRSGRYSQAPRPDLILLDLKLPRKSGREALDEILLDPFLCEIPVILLSSSKSELDLARAFGLPDECYMVKPDTYRGYVDLVRTIEAFRCSGAREET